MKFLDWLMLLVGVIWDFIKSLAPKAVIIPICIVLLLLFLVLF